MYSRKITIQDIARHAEVSAGTVDRVIHNRGRVSPDKKKKVEDSVKELNFNPNLVARALALRNNFRVCSLLPESNSKNDYWYLPNYGVKQASANLRDFGFHLEAFYFCLFDEISFIGQADHILDMNPDGVILAPLFYKESITFINKLEEKNIPYLFIDASIPDHNNISYIGPDVEKSGYIAGKLLNTQLVPGDHVLVLNIVKGMENSTNLSLIEQGFRNYFKENQESKENKISTLVINSMEEPVILQELTKFYIKNPDVKGVFVTTSKAHIAARFHYNHELAIRLIGFDLVEDNIQQLREGHIDWIISQSPVQQGNHAVRTMFDLLVNKVVPQTIQYVPLDIVIRENLDYYVGFFK